MLALSIVLSLLFLIWTFFVTTTTHALTRLGQTLSLEIISKHKKRFFYFKKSSFESLVFSSILSENLARFGFASMILFAIFQLETPHWIPIVITLIVAIFVMLLIGDFFPRIIANRSPEKALTFSLGLSSLFLCLSFPFSFIFFKIFESASRFGKAPQIDPMEEMKETIVQILQSANVRGKLDNTDKKLIEAVVKFKERIVREVMVPRIDLFSLPCETTIREAAHHFLEEGYSRIPVYQESVDNIVGVLMFKDFLKLCMEAIEKSTDHAFLDGSIESVTKSVFYTPETKQVSHLLQEFRTKQMHLAIVVDEYGGTEGVVTIEDILEEIVGEIADEYDLDEDTLYTAAPGSEQAWIVDARMSILDAEDAFHIQIPQEGDYDTIGGYIFQRVGSIPQKGLKIHHDDFTIEILSSTERSIEKVKISPRRESQQ